MVSDYTVFRVQAGFSFSILVFCMGMLIANKDPTYYLPILTSIIGYWLPAPQFRGNTTSAPALLPSAVRDLPALFMKRQRSTIPLGKGGGDVEMGAGSGADESARARTEGTTDDGSDGDLESPAESPAESPTESPSLTESPTAALDRGHVRSVTSLPSHALPSPPSRGRPS